MDNGDRAVVEVAHQHDGMPQILAEEDRVAQHAIALENALPCGQTEVAVEDVEHRTRCDLEIDALTVAGLAPRMMAQVVVLMVADGKGAEHRDAERALLETSHRAEERYRGETSGQEGGLVMMR